MQQRDWGTKWDGGGGDLQGQEAFSLSVCVLCSGQSLHSPGEVLAAEELLTLASPERPQQGIEQLQTLPCLCFRERCSWPSCHSGSRQKS